MPIFFYRANFCAECGNRLGRISLWNRLKQGSYLCTDCANHLHRQPYLLPVLCLIGGALIVFGFNLRKTNTSSQPLSLAVSAYDTSLQLKPNSPGATIEYDFCGARTKKGTPCKHRVPKGQRCTQHQGQPSMLSITAPTQNRP